MSSSHGVSAETLKSISTPVMNAVQAFLGALPGASSWRPSEIEPVT